MKIKFYKNIERTATNWSFGILLYKDSWLVDEVLEKEDAFDGGYILIDLFFWSITVGLEIYKNK